jgi:hypothetical protein
MQQGPRAAQQNLEQINLRHGPGDIHERINSAEARKCIIHDLFSGRRFTKVKRKHQAFSSAGLRLLRCLLQVLLVPRDQCER